VRHLSPEELSPEELDAVSGGWFCFGCWGGGGGGKEGPGQNDPAQQFQQILQQLTQG
jgi:hypothetical protein